MDVPEFSTGFLFNKTLDKVVLIQKNRPEKQVGKLNGVGGKVERGESGYDAMLREFREETGVDSKDIKWKHFVNVTDAGAFQRAIFCAVAESDDLFYSVRSTTDELVTIVSVDDIPTLNTMSNVKWLVPLAKESCIVGDMFSRVSFRTSMTGLL